MVTLTRSPKAGGPAREVAWDGKTLGPWASELDGALAVVNFTGRSVNCRYTPENRREIVASRVDGLAASRSITQRIWSRPVRA